MSYFREKIGRFTRNYGHLSGTLIFNTTHSLEIRAGLEAVGNILSCKNLVEEALNSLESIRKHCELIDEFSGSNQLQTVDRLRNSLRNETLGALDLSMKHTTRKEYPLALESFNRIRTQLSKHTDDAMELVTLKESFDVGKLPLDYVEFFETGKMRFTGRIFLSYSIKTKN